MACGKCVTFLHPLQEEHGYLVLLAVFAAVDDTVLIGKALLGVSDALVWCTSPINTLSTRLIDKCAKIP